MASQEQIEANRLNAQKSTGPHTPEGKAASRMNALKSGIDAKSQIIRGEKAANLETLQSEYYGRFHPTTPEQRMLVDTLIDAEWLLRRFRVCEAQLWEQGALYTLRPNDEIEIGQAFHNNSDYFARLQRRIDTAHRNYRNALHELERLQAGEAAPDAQPASATPHNQKAKPPNGFVPHPPAENPTEAPPPHPNPRPPDFAGPSPTASGL
jgi:hypothetical protein